MRYKLLIEYDGRSYAGWQRQADLPTVQGAIEAAIKAMTGEDVTLRGAGRTDAGVHATGQVAHFDLAKPARNAQTVRDGLNAFLRQSGEAVSVLGAEEAAIDFDARFSATARHYVYRILNRRAPPAMSRGQVWWVPKPIDAARMHDAAQVLIGRHDFTTFRSTQCQASSPIRTLDRLDVTQAGEIIEVRASARSFLHNQVRSMVGTIKRAGEGAWTTAEVRAALDAVDRTRCASVAPPDGLVLTAVDYENS